MSNTTALPARDRHVLADLLPGTIARDTILVICGASFVGLLAQFTLHLSFTPVPVTGQTLGVLLVATTLGARRATSAMITYAVFGLMGVPWFANHQSGYVGASFGYVIGFVLCAALCGSLAETGGDRSIPKSAATMIAGEVAIYVTGVAWLGAYLHVSAGRAIALGFTPFLVGDLIKGAGAALLMPAAWKLTGRR